MARQQHTIIIRFIAAQGGPYRLCLEGPDVGKRRRCAFRAQELYPAPHTRHLGQGMSNTTIEFYEQQLFIAREIDARKSPAYLENKCW